MAGMEQLEIHSKVGRDMLQRRHCAVELIHSCSLILSDGSRPRKATLFRGLFNHIRNQCRSLNHGIWSFTNELPVTSVL